MIITFEGDSCHLVLMTFVIAENWLFRGGEKVLDSGSV